MEANHKNKLSTDYTGLTFFASCMALYLIYILLFDPLANASGFSLVWYLGLFIIVICILYWSSRPAVFNDETHLYIKPKYEDEITIPLSAIRSIYWEIYAYKIYGFGLRCCRIEYLTDREELRIIKFRWDSDSKLMFAFIEHIRSKYPEVRISSNVI